MRINVISSESNNIVKSVRALQKRQNREKEKLFLLEGSHCLIEALRKDLPLKYILASESFLDNRMGEIDDLNIEQISVVEDKIFNSLFTTSSSCGVVAVAPIPAQKQPEISKWSPRVIAVADAVQDPGNLGTIMRTALAAELGGLLILKGSVDPYNPKLVRAAAGALFSLPFISDIAPEEAVQILRQNGYKLISCEANAATRYFEAKLADSVAIILGNEGQGVNETLRSSADESISIPMNPQSESLNVAISGGIILFETLKQRLVVANR